jgi:hypothetical protein
MSFTSISAAGAVGIIGALFVGVPPSTATGTQMTVTGNAPFQGGVARLMIERIVATDSVTGVPTVLEDDTVDQKALGADGSFVLTLPTTAANSTAVNGIVTATVATFNSDGSRSSVSYLPISIRNNTANGAQLLDNQVISVGNMNAALAAPAGADPSSNLSASASPDVVPPCVWDLQSTTEKSTRIGELHVANQAGSEGRFTYKTQADSTLSVGLSTDGKNYSASGSVTVSNSLGASGGYTEGKGTLTYAHDNMYFGHYIGSYWSCGASDKVQATKSTGDSFPGSGTPPGAPWSTCHDDPNGYAKIAANGFWDVDRAKAVHYDAVATAFNFTVSGRTGYTDGIHIKLTNNGSQPTFACGTAQMPDVPIVYNKPS